MDISLRWLNAYLDPADLGADEADRLLTQAGFPIEGRTETPDGDIILDVEVTSNRGDCLSHIGCAREVAAMPTSSVPRRLVLPEPAPCPAGPPAGSALALHNDDPARCPRFTATVIRGVRVGPSPEWLVRRLEAVGQRSINAPVDVTNFITFEWGNPCHVFDLKKLAANADGLAELRIRGASEGERLRTLDGRERVLRVGELIVADGRGPTSLAGVMGGADSEVDAGTTDIVFEMATWDPVTVRNAARRLGVRTDAGHRFERGVHPGTIDAARARAVSLIAELCGGEVGGGVLEAGRGVPAPVCIGLRPSRASLLLGIDCPPDVVASVLGGLGIGVEAEGEDRLRCTIPAHRLDLTREVDLIEEVARVRGLESIPVPERISVRVRPAQASERGQHAVASTLTGLGFWETVTFSFVTPEHAALFLPPGLEAASVDDERRGAEPTLRPSVIPSLLGCRRANRSAQDSVEGGVRLFEMAAVFAQEPAAPGVTARSVESRSLAMIMDVPGASLRRTHDELQHALRVMRGVVEAVVACSGGRGAGLEVGPIEQPPCRAWLPDGLAGVRLGGEWLGPIGLIDPDVLRRFDLDEPVVACELSVDRLIAGPRPRAGVEPLPQFPAIERDLSFIVGEDVRWGSIEAAVREARPALLERVAYVGTFRGRQVGAGRKSVTVRLRFRDPTRTLRHEEVDPQVEAVIGAARAALGAELRS